jgi:transposase
VAGKKLWVGIDVGKKSHHACAVDDRGKVVFSRKVGNGQAAVEDLIARTNTEAVYVYCAMRWLVFGSPRTHSQAPS